MNPLFRMCFILPLFSLPCACTITDEQSLIDFKNSITSDPQNVLAHWVPTIHFCNWTGVTCDSTSNRVQLLELADKQLGGSISPSIGNLSFLTQLHLTNNSFVGQIPQEIGRIRGLKALYLPINLLQGSIPTNLSSCKELKELSLAANRLTGTIPPELSLLTSLRVLKLGSNNLSGTIPSFLGNLSFLETLNMHHLDLEGHIPPEFGMLTSLTSFILVENPRLTGPIPSSMSNSSRLVVLALYSNNLTGIIPPELGKLSRLTFLYLWDNQLRGTIPRTIANCTQLRKLDLELNHLSGEVPLDLSRLSDLKLLSLSSNRLVSGSSVTIPILTALRNCTSLNKLWIHDNNLTGYLPEQLPTNLSMLLLNGNKIKGSIPSHIADISNLTHLNLSSNLLTGSIPSSLRRLDNLQRLLLDNNKLEGNIPREIGEIKNLGELSLSHNMLSGEIPDTIGRLQQLIYLVLNHNQLSGNVPADLGKCYNLQLLDLSNNQFSDGYPVKWPVSLIYSFISICPELLGRISASEIGKMIHVQAIDVSANKLEGQIPASLGSCQELEYLKLSLNELQGSVPSSLRYLRSLVSMDLSSNNLSGLIPVSLKSLNMLQYLNLSFNNFSGEIPKEGIFRNFTAASFMGNMFLCGEWMQLPSCPVQNTQPKDHDNRIRIIAPVAGTLAFLFFCLLILGLIYRRRKMKSNVRSDILPLKVSDDGGISYQEIVKATDGFNQKNLLGTGSFGSVYKGIMSDGRVAAFKLLNLKNKEAFKSFCREYKVLAEVRHRNLVKIISFCLDFGHKILVLEFMSKGNLETLLHCNGYPMTFIEILNIAIDVIHGLEYLHHDCFLQFVHCDIKPSNILMDEDMTAHVADFGISRIICDIDSESSIGSGSTSTPTLKGSMGYIAPEYGVAGMVTTKGDIYSYGIMLMEMVTRKSPTDHMFVGGLDLHKWVSMHFDNKLEEIIDMTMIKNTGEYEINQCLIPFLRTALECSKESPKERPTAREVAGVLENIREAFV